MAGMMDHFKIELRSLLERWKNELSPLIRSRNNAFDQFMKLGLPTKKWEDWQFTDFSILGKIPFRLTNEQDPIVADDQIPKIADQFYSLVAINGNYQPQMTNLPAGVEVIPLFDQFLKNDLPTIPEELLNPFWILNSAMMNSGLRIRIAKNVQVDQPIYYYFLTTDMAEPVMNHPRLIMELEQDSSAVLVMHYNGKQSPTYWNNCVTNTHLHEHAKLEIIQIQQDRGFHTDNFYNVLESNTQLITTFFNSHTELYRGDNLVQFSGENALAEIQGLSLLNQKQHMDMRVMIDHAVPHCTSRQNFKYILDHSASGVFSGKVNVSKNSHKTDANQINKNLLMSKNSTMNSNPQLEIQADDVRCSHGSSTGQLDEEILYYLRTRGIDLTHARKLMIKGFAGEILSRIKHEAISNYLNQQLNQWLDHG